MAHVLAWIHGYPPVHNAGAEWALHEMLVYLQADGHSVRVLQGMPHPGSWEGIEVGDRTSPRGMLREARNADVILTHLDHSAEAARAAHQVGIPCIHYVHNHRQLSYNGIEPWPGDLVVFNSRWLARYLSWPQEHIVCTPLVTRERYAADPRAPHEHVTQVYLSRSKGAEVFYELAEREPQRQFLGVVGSYGDQYQRDDLANVSYQANTAMMRDAVYAHTRVLLMPSDYESWGRAAVEAMCSGIPVIAHPTSGLAESLGYAGIYEDREHIDGWQLRLIELDDATEYERRSSSALRRAEELEARALGELSKLSEWLRDRTRR